MDILFEASFKKNGVQALRQEQLSHNALVATATIYIRKNIAGKISINDVCVAVGTNSSTLNFNFRREFNMSVGQFITSERMKRARQLLIKTTYTISEIAIRCGFDNVYYFSNVFKKVHGVSPTEYKYDYE